MVKFSSVQFDERRGCFWILVPVLLMLLLNNLIFGQLAVVLVLVSPVFTRSPSQPVQVDVEPGRGRYPHTALTAPGPRSSHCL